mgnify:CR=1 FL=1
MIKPIITDKNLLSNTSESVSIFSAEDEVIQDLLYTANSMYGRCAGLAAPQIGYDVRVVAVLLSGGFTIMVNPEYIYKKGKLLNGNEGCLSRPGTIKKPVNVKRFYKIRIRYTDINGDVVETKFRSMNARVIQHEIDHLDGILI